RPVLDRAADLSGRRYGADHTDDVRMRVIAHHVRSSLMLMSDGVTPSNDGRRYILRRLMRRTDRAMRLLGVDAPTFPDLIAAPRDAMPPSHPAVEPDYGRPSQAAAGEEETLLRTLAGGTRSPDLADAKAKDTGRTRPPGETAFLLPDTYGFPIDHTLE